MLTHEQTDLELFLTEEQPCEWDHENTTCDSVVTHAISCACENDTLLACHAGANEALAWMTNPFTDCDNCNLQLGACWSVRVA